MVRRLKSSYANISWQFSIRRPFTIHKLRRVGERYIFGPWDVYCRYRFILRPKPDPDAASSCQPVESVLMVGGTWFQLLIAGARCKQAE